FFMGRQADSKHAWTVVLFGPNHDAIHLIVKRPLKVGHPLRPVPGKTAAHVEFPRDRRHLLLSVCDPDGALLVSEADTPKEIKRIPMNEPSGEYNVGNKIGFVEGTSHGRSRPETAPHRRRSTPCVGRRNAASVHTASGGRKKRRPPCRAIISRRAV